MAKKIVDGNDLDDESFGRQYSSDEVRSLLAEAIGDAQASAFQGSKSINGKDVNTYITDLLGEEDE